MHIFVTGGPGQTGPAIVTELITAGHTITSLPDLKRQPHVWGS